MATPDSHAHAAHSSAADAEPKTPMWLPAVGALLFLVAGVYGVATRTPDPSEADAIAAAQSAAPAKSAATAVPRAAITNRPPTIPPPSALTMRLPQGAAPTQKRAH